MGICLTEPLNAPATTQNHLTGISYDIAGNVVNDGNGNTPTYDAENRIATDAGVNYYYDADGFRMEKSSGTMYWPGPGGEILTETDLTGTINEEYIFFGGERIARVDRPSGAVHYYFSDRLASASVITDSLGSPSERYYFFPYGGMAFSSGSDPNHYKFTGKERDSESGLDMFGARYYGSSLGRFMTPDPLYVEMHRLADPQQLNIYAYGRNNPLKFFDPTGLDIAVKCADQKNCIAATDQVNARKDKKFDVEIGKDGKWHPVGKVDVGSLKGAEKAFYGALTDSNTHATLTAVSGDSGVLFGSSTGKGANTVDVADTAQLAGAGLSPGMAVAHEAMEAYATAGDPNYDADPNASLSAAHNNDPFPGFTGVGRGGSPVTSNGNLTGYQYTLRYNGTGALYQVNTSVTPIPVASFTKSAASRAEAIKTVQTTEQITSVTPK